MKGNIIMKKKYIQPTMTTTKVMVEQVIAASGQATATSMGFGGDATADDEACTKARQSGWEDGGLW